MNQRKRALDVNQVFAYRLRDARLTKRWTQEDLAEAMARIGHPINRATIAKIEAGARGVGGAHGRAGIKKGETAPRGISLKEAIAFAVALDVAPMHLFLPIIDEDDVQLAPRARADVQSARAWVRGERPLGEDDRFYRLQAPYEPRKATLADLEALGIPVRPEPNREEES